LRALGQREGFAVTPVSSYLSNGEQVRSSEIRRRITSGDLAGARALLGRNHGFSGRVEDDGPVAGSAGDSSGRARLTFDLPVCLPPDGEYPVLLGPAWLPGQRPDPATHASSIKIAAGVVTAERADWQLPDRVRAVFLDRG
jgi:hypothetical protein